MQSPSRTAPIFQSAAAVERVVVCPNTGLMAMLSSDHQLQVYSTRDQTLRYATLSAREAAEEQAE